MRPLPQSGPCRRRENGELKEAPLCVVGLDPCRTGGGVLYWAWTLSEAGEAADAFREHGFHDVKVMNSLTQKTVDYVHDLILELLEETESEGD